MRPIFFTLLFLSSFCFAQEITQEEAVEAKSVEDTSAVIDNVSDPSQTSEASSLDVPSGLE